MHIVFGEMGIKQLEKVLLVSRNTFLRIYVKEIKYGKSSDKDVDTVLFI